MPPKDSYIIEMNPPRKLMTTYTLYQTSTRFINNGPAPINAVCSYEGDAA